MAEALIASPGVAIKLGGACGLDGRSSVVFLSTFLILSNNTFSVASGDPSSSGGGGRSSRTGGSSSSTSSSSSSSSSSSQYCRHWSTKQENIPTIRTERSRQLNDHLLKGTPAEFTPRITPCTSRGRVGRGR